MNLSKKHDSTLWGAMIPLILIAVVMYVFMRWWAFCYLGGNLEGWFPYYSSLVRAGEVPYRDFYLFTTPLNVFIGAALTSVFPDTLEVYRQFGVFERIALTAVLYLWMKRYFSSFSSFVAAITGVMIFSLHFMDTVYYYTIEAILFAVICCWLFSIAAESTGKRQAWFSVLAGVFAALCVLTKHTTGVGLSGALVFALVYYQYTGSRSLVLLGYGALGAVIPWVVAIVYLLMTSSLTNFVSAMSNGSSSKGSLSTILTRPLSNYFVRNPDVFWGLAIFVFLVMFVIGRRLEFEKPMQQVEVQWLIAWVFSICTILIVVLNPVLFYYFPYRSRYISIFYNLISDFALCFGICVVTCWLLRDRRQSNLIGPLLAAAFGLMQIYVYNWSAGNAREAWSLLPLVPFAVAWQGDFHGIWGEYVKPILVGVVGIAIVITSMSLRKKSTYTWESWREFGEVQNAVSFGEDILKLNGTRAAQTVVHGVSELVAESQRNRQSTDTLYTFPFFPILNWLTDRPTGVYAPVPYFDVCPDDVAKRDATTLRAHPPATIVVADLPEKWIVQREEFFRDGKRSGQREILKAIDELKPQYEPAKRIKIPEFEFDLLVLQRK